MPCFSKRKRHRKNSKDDLAPLEKQHRENYFGYYVQGLQAE
jgi:hypothetical protein